MLPAIVFIALSLVCSIASSAEASYKVIAFIPESGEWADVGQSMRAGYDAALRISAPKKPFELIYVDCSDVSNLKLSLPIYATDPDVIAFIGGMPGSKSFIIAEIAEDYGIPFVIDCNSTDSLTRTPRDFVFRITPPANDFNDGVISWAATVAGRNRLAAIVHDTSRGYVGYTADLEQDLARHWEGDKEWLPYSFGTQDFRRQIELLRQTRPAILWLIGSTSDVARFLRQCRQADYLPHAVVLGSGEPVNSRLISLSEGACEFTVASRVWIPDSRLAEVREYCELFLKTNHEKPDYRAAACTANIQIFLELFENNSDITRELIRLELSENQFETVFGHIRFRSDERYYNQNRQITYAVQQQKEGWLEIWPLEYAVADDVYPVPDWRERARVVVKRPVSFERWLLLSITFAFIVFYFRFNRRKSGSDE